MTSLFVSPHFDDVALSCVAHVRRACERGRVVVLTVFAAGQPEREGENREALSMLGAESVVLPFADAPARLAVQPSFASLLLTRYDCEERDCNEIARAIAAVQRQVKATCVFLPLGVGGHVDHRVVHAAHRALPGEIRFFEDRPYADVPGALRARLLAVGANSGVRHIDPFPELPVVRDGVMRVFGPVLSSQSDRYRSTEAFCHDLLSTPRGPSLMQLEPDVLLAQRSAEEVIACYRSQIGDLFGDRDGLRRFVASRSIERVWRRASFL